MLTEEVKRFCTNCGSPLVMRKGPFGGQFLACSSFPKCKTTVQQEYKKRQKTIISEEIQCPLCNSPMKKISGIRGDFYGCSEYRASGCKGSRKIEEVEIYSKGVENIESIDSNKTDFEKMIETGAPKKPANKKYNVNRDSLLNSLFVNAKPQVEVQMPKFVEQIIPQKDIKLIDTSEYPHMTFKFKQFNPVQSEVFEYYDKDVNCVVAASTSAGKTTVAEMFMADSIAKGKKAIFLSPLKAVSQEKYDDWTNPEHSWSKLNVSIVTGDYQLTQQRVEELNKADVIVMTNEMLDSRTRRINIEQNDWLLKAGVLVCDESHLLCIKGRGDRSESALMRFSKQNLECRIVLLSATMPNVEQLAQWTTSLNNKKTELINSTYRPIVLDIHYETYNDQGNYYQQEDNKISKAIEITQQHRESKFIVFVHSKQTGKNIERILKDMGEKVLLHNAELTLKERVEVSERFHDKNDIRIIVATSTLAWGVNLPARRTIIVGVHRGMNEVEPLDVKQMCGRSGRVGYDEKGDAHILLPESRFARFKSWCQNIPPIMSTMNDQDILAFHIISEIAEGEVYDIESLMNWYNRSLAAFQSNYLDRIDAETLLFKLTKSKVIEKKGSQYSVTKLGKVASLLYYSPYTISGWYQNFNSIFNQHVVDDISISWALCNINENSENYIGRDLKKIATNFIKKCNEKGLNVSDGCASVGIAFYACLSFDESLGQIKGRVKFDIERTISALKLIDSMYAKWDKNKFWDQLQLRIVYEVSEAQTELCGLKGIGGMKARRLFANGIKTIEDLKAKKFQSIQALGEVTYNKVMEENEL